MLCSSHAFHPSFPNTIPASLRRLVYGRILPFDSSETEMCKHPTDLQGFKLPLTSILITNSTIIFLINELSVVGPKDGFCVLHIFEHIVPILSYNNNLITE